jgi:hypothetical protein
LRNGFQSSFSIASTFLKEGIVLPILRNVPKTKLNRVARKKDKERKERGRATFFF